MKSFKNEGIDMKTKDSEQSRRNIKILGAGILAAIGASLCCITPVLAVIAGISGAASTFSWLEPLRPYLIGITVLVLGFAWYQRLKPRTREEIACACEDDKKITFWQTKTFLAIVTVFAVILLAFPYYSGLLLPENQANTIVVKKDNIFEANLHIEGMTCTGCENSVNYALKSKAGVVEATSDYKTGIALVKFDRTRVSLDKLARSIEDEVGYKVTARKIIKHKK
jgi:copper chaperone CopZ